MSEVANSVNPLTLFAVSHRSEQNAWRGLVEFCIVVLKNADPAEPSQEVLENELSRLEQEYKEVTGESTLPSRYRSSKSICLKALRLGIAVCSMTESGDIEPYPKSYLGRRIKAAEEEDPARLLGVTAYSLSRQQLAVDAVMRSIYRGIDTHGHDFIIDLKGRLKDAGYI